MITRTQLLALGFSTAAIAHRLERGRLHVVHRGVYAVGRRELSRLGEWMAAVLRGGRDAVLSHMSAMALWGIARAPGPQIELSVPRRSPRRAPDIVIHRARLERTEVTVHRGIPVTTPARTLVDFAARATRDEVEAAVNEADRLGLVDPETMRAALDEVEPRPGVGKLRRVLDRRTFTVTRSQLERRFIPIARAAGLPRPETCVRVNGFEVDFFFRALGLVVETDGLTYHRTPAQQARDRLRDQVHTAAGLITLRFTHAQVRYEPEHVRLTLAATARRLAA